MRAFMSRISDEPHDETAPGAYLAVREARRILAETEPDEPQTACFGIERVAARHCAPNEWTGALAEALAAFVAE